MIIISETRAKSIHYEKVRKLRKIFVLAVRVQNISRWSCT